MLEMKSEHIASTLSMFRVVTLHWVQQRKRIDKLKTLMEKWGLLWETLSFSDTGNRYAPAVNIVLGIKIYETYS